MQKEDESLDYIDQETFIDIKEASKLLNCHALTLTRKAQTNAIPAYKRLNKWVFKRADLAKLYKPNEAATKTDDIF
jgi:excisionase family DNA binding protein